MDVLDLIERYAGNPCGDGGSSPGFHKGNTCQKGGGKFRLPSTHGGKVIPAGKLAEAIDRNSPGVNIDVQKYKKVLGDESPYFGLTRVQVKDLKGYEGVDPSDANPKIAREPVVIDSEGNVLDGRHRVALAVAQRKTHIDAYAPVEPPGAPARAPEPPKREPAPPKPATEPHPQPPTTKATESPLKSFADKAVRAARASETGKFGESKTFIHHAWRQIRKEPEFGSIDIDTFKKMLVQANQARHLDLSRADLIEGMDPADVRESDTHHMGATFNFIKFNPYESYAAAPDGGFSLLGDLFGITS